MELIGKLKEKISKAKSKDEAKDIMEDAGMRLTDDELGVVAGGMFHFDIWKTPRGTKEFTHGRRGS